MQVFKDNRHFDLSFEDKNVRESHKRYFLPIIEIKDYNVMTDEKNVFNQPVKNDLKTCDNVHKISTGQGDDYANECLLDYPYFKKWYKSIVINWSKQQKLGAFPKAMQQINFNGNLERDGDAFHYWRSARNYFRFFTRNCKSIVSLFCFSMILTGND